MQIIGHHIIILDEIDSTNNYAANLLAASKAVEGTVIMAQNQLAGRGQRGNAWQSVPGGSLAFSVILFPRKFPVADQHLLNEATAVAVCQGLEEITGINAFIKWPNDIFICDKKVAGILIENTVSGGALASSIIGIGVNLNQEVFSNLAMAASLKKLTGRSFDAAVVMKHLLDRLDYWYAVVKAGGATRLREYYLQRMYLLNQAVKFRVGDQEKWMTVKGLDKHGNLQLQDSEGEVNIFSVQEVSWLL